MTTDASTIPAATALTGTSVESYADVYKRLRAIDCAAHVEKKNGFTYLSWAYAIDILQQHAPGSSWKVCEFGGELIRGGDGALLLDEFGDPRLHGGVPYQQTDGGCFVRAAVRVAGVVRTISLPVLDGDHRVIAQPTAFDINTSAMRCLVKAIALHGLGLYIYAGEDLPATNAPAPTSAKAGALKVVATAPAPTTAELLATHTRKLALANTSTLLGYHQNADKYFEGAELAAFRADIAKRAGQLKVTLPELPLPVAA